jgi:hypothetical protein
MQGRGDAGQKQRQTIDHELHFNATISSYGYLLLGAEAAAAETEVEDFAGDASVDGEKEDAGE